MKRTLPFSLVMIAVIIGGWYFMMGKPTKARIAVLQKDIRTESKKLSAYRDALTRFNDRIKEHERLNLTIEDSPLLFSGKDEVISLYHELDSLCHQPGYELHEITPSLDEVIQFLREWAQSDSMVTIPIRIKMEATYRSLANLIKAIEESRYYQHLKICRIYGTEDLYPRCHFDVTFIAGLNNRLELFDLE
jgi:hypothetical protein